MSKDKVFVGMSPKEHPKVPTGHAIGSGKKVFVGMSGGVDSSVSAALLKEQGYDVTGVFIKVWQADFLPCNWREERRDAMRVAAHLSIPFVTLDLEKEYKEEVVDYMIREYAAGRIPNPDVMCNKHVKFGAFYAYAKTQGAELIATGHYARKESQAISHKSQEYSTTHGSDKSLLQLETCNFKLLTGVDKEKDQSYFLWTIDQDVLSHTLFPVGHLEKNQVRELASRFGLPNAEKKDSQGLCFMGKIDMSDFLKHYLRTIPGNVLSEDGSVIGTHNGALLYTIGQRKGFETQKISEHEEPYFVIAKDIDANTVTVAHRTKHDVSPVASLVHVSGVHIIHPGRLKTTSEIPLFARIRYRGELFPVEVKGVRSEGGECEVRFMHSVEGIAPGQSLVFYRGDECEGGAVIVSADAE